MATSLKRTYPLNSLSQLELHQVVADFVTYRARWPVRLVESAEETAEEHASAILSTSDFKDGVIQTAVAGALRPDAPQDMRGFVGVGFRVRPDGSWFGW